MVHRGEDRRESPVLARIDSIIDCDQPDILTRRVVHNGVQRTLYARHRQRGRLRSTRSFCDSYNKQPVQWTAEYFQCCIGQQLHQLGRWQRDHLRRYVSWEGQVAKCTMRFAPPTQAADWEAPVDNALCRSTQGSDFDRLRVRFDKVGVFATCGKSN